VRFAWCCTELAATTQRSFRRVLNDVLPARGRKLASSRRDSENFETASTPCVRRSRHGRHGWDGAVGGDKPFFRATSGGVTAPARPIGCGCSGRRCFGATACRGTILIVPAALPLRLPCAPDNGWRGGETVGEFEPCFMVFLPTPAQARARQVQQARELASRRRLPLPRPATNARRMAPSSTVGFRAAQAPNQAVHGARGD
jgi:hypothetical protein